MIMAGNNVCCRVIFLPLLLFLNSAVADPEITAKPVEINLGLSDVLDMNCSYSVKSSSNMTHLISVMLTRAVNDSNDEELFTDLATIGQFSTKVSLLTTEDVTATGFFRDSSESFLHLRWEYPTEEQTGVYRCVAHTSDRYGRLSAQNAVVQVTGNQPTFDEWKAKVREMSITMKHLETKVGDLEQQKKISDTFIDHVTYRNSTYYVYKKFIYNVYTARAICEQFGGHLVQINDVGEYETLRSYLKSIPQFPQGFIVEGTDQRQEGRWVFPATNERLPSLRWAKGDPNGGRGQNCLVLWRPGDLRLADISCYPSGYQISFVCEIPRRSN